MEQNSRKFNRIAVRRYLIIAAFAILLSALPVYAASLEDYRGRIKAAQVSTTELLEYVAESEIDEVDPEIEKEIIAEIRESIPQTEKIEWPGGNVETANGWLVKKLEDFENEQDTGKRAVILTELNELLASLDVEIEDLENAIIAESSKDENKQKLAEILRRAEYQKPEEPKKSLAETWLEKVLNWLQGLMPEFAPSEPSFEGAPSLARIIIVLLGLGVLALIIFAVYKFAPLLGLRHRTKTKKIQKDRVILGELIAADETGANIFSEAERLAREGDLRGAIRKGYIATLCELSDRKIIGLARHKTNRDYLRDIRSRSELFQNVQEMTSSFERHWYGFRSADKEDWDDFRANYSRTIDNAR